MAVKNLPRPVIFGEVLFDHFPDGASVLGGAPFNVAWHLNGFGLSPLFVSRVGDDAYGHRIKRSMAEWGLDSAGLQTDPEHPTGVVEVGLDDGQPTFSIVPDQAYDFIDAERAQATSAAADATWLYHGTLAARNPISRAALDGLLADANRSLFMDINLRDPWWQAEDLPVMLKRAHRVKLNDDELGVIASIVGLSGNALTQQAAALQAAFAIDLLIVTRGAQGAMAREASGTVHTVSPQSTIDVVDTVGAGDAFSAVVLVGLMRGWPLPVVLERAQAFASAVCGVRGATVEERDFYRRHSGAWGE